MMMIIEVGPHKWGWRVFEAPGVEPVFLQKEQAIGYAEARACFRKGEIRIFRVKVIGGALGFILIGGAIDWRPR